MSAIALSSFVVKTANGSRTEVPRIAQHCVTKPHTLHRIAYLPWMRTGKNAGSYSIVGQYLRTRPDRGCPFGRFGIANAIAIKQLKSRFLSSVVLR